MSLKGTLMALMILTQVQPGVCQFRNVMLDETEVAKGGLCQPVIAVNPRRPENIVADATPDNIYVTKDGGTTWNKVKASSPLGIAGEPAIITDDKGNFFYFHLSEAASGGDADAVTTSRVVIQTSGDGGVTWSAGEAMTFSTPANQHNPWATIDSRGNLYVTWTKVDKTGELDSACQSNVLFSMSKNGKKWTDPVVITQQPGDCREGESSVGGAVPIVTFDGKVLISWSSQGKIFLDRSFNGGEWWLSNDIVVESQKGDNVKIPGYIKCSKMPVLMTDLSKGSLRGSLYMVWADQRNGENDTDVWFTRSHNYGDNWATPMRVNNDAAGKHQYLPWMAIDGATGFIYIIYYDRRNHDDNNTDVYLAYSTNGGASFTNKLISETPFTPVEGEMSAARISISAQKGVIAPIWTRMDGGKTSVWTAVIRHEELEKAQ
ncbi:MAG: glycoside hydrolase [Bacteroidota bacterium]|nr:glycoside hydrolase [Bacteroidota bacterium]